MSEFLNKQVDAYCGKHEASRSRLNRIAATRDAERQLREARDCLREHLTQDPQAQLAIVRALRGRVKYFQYEPVSIAFEIFQDADDAVVEQEMLTQGAAADRAVAPVTDERHPGSSEVLPSEMRQFVVRYDATRIVFMHWGRSVNRPHGLDTASRQRGDRRDLATNGRGRWRLRRGSGVR